MLFEIALLKKRELLDGTLIRDTKNFEVEKFLDELLKEWSY